jgi:hypothetical protein
VDLLAPTPELGVPRPWPRLRPALGIGVATVVLGYLLVNIGVEPRPPLFVDAATEIDAPHATEVVRSVSAHDFSIVVKTGVCTTLEWSWSGPGSTGDDVKERCATSHILSPPITERLDDGASYQVSARFADPDGNEAGYSTSITTEAEAGS